MDSRREFIRKGAILCAAASLSPVLPSGGHAAVREIKVRDPKKALILYYTQTGMTRLYGGLIACLLKDKGLAVHLADMRLFDKKNLTDYDLILVGAPVFYYDIPSNVKDWLTYLPPIPGVPVAAFVSFGGPEGNQHNSLCHVLRLLENAGGAAVGMDAFRSVPGYPTPGWDSANQRSGEHLPDDSTFEQVRIFITRVREQIDRGQSVGYEAQIAFREFLRILPLVWLNKKAIGRHTVDGEKCILCQTCVKTCPTGAIHPDRQFVDRDHCIACFGCLNNCPADAVVMEYRGKKLYGFPEYLRRRKITIAEPPEFQTCRPSDTSMV